MFHKIKKVKALKDYILEVTFENDEIKYYDIKPLFKRWDSFQKLENKELFSQVKVDLKGYGISWNDDLDLSCNELYNNGK